MNLKQILGNVLLVGAHPDDIEINAGGTVARLLENDVRVTCLVMSSDNIRSEESYRALRHLGVSSEDSIYMGGYPDTELCKYVPAMVGQIDKRIKDDSIETVITHHHADTHQDHNAVSKSCGASSRLIKNLLYFQPTYPSGRTDIPFHPNLIVPLTRDHINRKTSALMKHASQITKYGEDQWLDRVVDIAKADAWKVGGFHGFAELFEISRIRL